MLQGDRTRHKHLPPVRPLVMSGFPPLILPSSRKPCPCCWSVYTPRRCIFRQPSVPSCLYKFLFLNLSFPFVSYALQVRGKHFSLFTDTRFTFCRLAHPDPPPATSSPSPRCRDICCLSRCEHLPSHWCCRIPEFFSRHPSVGFLPP